MSVTSQPRQLDSEFSDAVVAGLRENRMLLPLTSGAVMDGTATWSGEVLSYPERAWARSALLAHGTTALADDIDSQPLRQPVAGAEFTVGKITPLPTRTTRDVRFVIPGEGEVRPPAAAALEPAEVDISSANGEPRGMSDAALAIVRELLPQYDGLLPARVVGDYVTQAVSDLTGSICIESLPEMAVRLASVRLLHLLEPGQPTDDVQVSSSHHSLGAPDPHRTRR